MLDDESESESEVWCVCISVIKNFCLSHVGNSKLPKKSSRIHQEFQSEIQIKSKIIEYIPSGRVGWFAVFMEKTGSSISMHSCKFKVDDSIEE